ncbi:MAG: BCCT family betaine/carnitine transporter, partial [Bacteroidia bacterium]
MSSTSKADEIGHTIGDQNVNFMGLDIHNPVFMVSAILVIVFLAG